MTHAWIKRRDSSEPAERGQEQAEDHRWPWIVGQEHGEPLFSRQSPDAIKLGGFLDQDIDRTSHQDQRRTVIRILREQVAQDARGHAEVLLFELLQGLLVPEFQAEPVGLPRGSQLVEVDCLRDVDDADRAETPTVKRGVELGMSRLIDGTEKDGKEGTEKRDGKEETEKRTQLGTEKRTQLD